MAQNDSFSTRRAGMALESEVGTFASEVISVICDRQAPSPSGARQFTLNFLVRAVTSTQHFDPGLVLDELRGHRLSTDLIIDLYIPEAAVCLGDQWIRSDIDFATVTIGALRLQAILAEAASDRMLYGARMTPEHTALIVVPRGEQHFLGASVVSAQLRRLGCDVATSFAETEAAIVNRVIYDQPEMVLFTCSRVAGLEAIAKAVKKIRRHVNPAPVLALGGALRGDFAAIREKTNVDLVSKVAKDVYGFCAKRVKSLDKG